MQNPNNSLKSGEQAISKGNGGKAATSLFLAAISILALLASVMIGPASSLIIFFTATTGIVLGIKDLPSKSKKLALAGIIINAIVLPLGLASMGIRIDPPPPEIRPPEKLAPHGIGAIPNEKGFYEIVHPTDKSIMVSIPPGEFTMGSNAYSAEKPVQQIYLDHYYIDKYLVTNDKFEKFVDETGYVTDAEKIGPDLGRSYRRRIKFSGANWKMPDGLTPIDGKENHPVSQISYNDAIAYCQWAKKDLPTEAQWEKAARGTDGREYPWGNSEPNNTMANFDNNDGPTPVTEYDKGQSPYGLFDMAGNVYQWCKDWYGTGERGPKNPSGPLSGKEHVIKGGSFSDDMKGLRSAYRDHYPPNYSSFVFGFRCSCEKITDQLVNSGSNKK